MIPTYAAEQNLLDTGKPSTANVFSLLHHFKPLLAQQTTCHQNKLTQLLLTFETQQSTGRDQLLATSS